MLVGPLSSWGPRQGRVSHAMFFWGLGWCAHGVGAGCCTEAGSGHAPSNPSAIRRAIPADVLLCSASWWSIHSGGSSPAGRAGRCCSCAAGSAACARGLLAILLAACVQQPSWTGGATAVLGRRAYASQPLAGGQWILFVSHSSFLFGGLHFGVE